MATFVNFSNHPSDKWSSEQMHAANEYGRVVDMQFPAVNPELSEEDIKVLADEYAASILLYEPAAVMCQGEFTLCYAVIERLKAENITVVAACSQRNVVESSDWKNKYTDSY